VLRVLKSASESATVLVGSVVEYRVVATNIGDSPVYATDVLPGTATPIRIDGQPATLLLARDVIPVGSTYEPGSLRTETPGAVRLYRLSGDAPGS
jgi:large repetitive protein